MHRNQKCDRGRYKRRLIEAIHATGTRPTLGGIEYAEDIVQKININRTSQSDRSFPEFRGETPEHVPGLAVKMVRQCDSKVSNKKIRIYDS